MDSRDIYKDICGKIEFNENYYERYLNVCNTLDYSLESKKIIQDLLKDLIIKPEEILTFGEYFYKKIIAINKGKFTFNLDGETVVLDDVSKEDLKTYFDKNNKDTLSKTEKQIVKKINKNR